VKANNLRMVLALAAVGALALTPAAGVGGKDEFDPLLDDSAFCGPPAGRPPLLQKLILAQAETKPFKPQPMQAAGGEVPLYDNLGTLSLKVGTRNAKAQAYFDQGLRWAFAFNHAEAQRAFQAAQQADPKLAMAWWGEALVLGPNINAPMMPEAAAPALAALAKAGELAPGAPAKDRALIAALQKRYSADPKAERAALDAAFADAMKSVAEKYPGDDTVLTLYAESVMDTQAWDYWEAGGAKPKGRAAELLAALEKVLARNPNHPGAIHLYIHAVEASTKPERALPHARRLAALIPGAGHIVHMPAHIFYRVGLYKDSLEINKRAMAVDEQYFSTSPSDPMYKSAYYPHNIHFLWAASSMQGQSKVAIEAARKVAANVRLEQIDQFPTVEFFHTIPLLSLVQFGHWDEILAEPQPRADLAYSNAIWRYARGVALANKGDVKGAKAEQAALVPLKANEKVMKLDGSDYPASQLLAIADNLLLGEIAQASGDTKTAVVKFTAAVAGQDALPYTEPPFWYYPTRQSLGAALLKAGKAAEAEAVYRKDLETYPHNGWSTFGLIQALDAQKKTDEANMLREHFKGMWSQADVELTGSRISASPI